MPIRKLLSKISTHPLIRQAEERLYRTSVGKRLSHGVLWTFIGNAAFRFLSAVSTITVARILGAQAYGEYGMIQSTVRMISMYAGFGLGATSTKYVAEFRKDNPARASRILHLTLTTTLFLCSSVSVVLLAGSEFFAEFFLDRTALSTGLSIGAVLLFFLVYGEAKQQALFGFEEFRAIAFISILRGVITPILTIPLAFYWGVEGALVGLALVAAITLVNSSKALKTAKDSANFTSRPTLVEAGSELPVLWRYALPGMLAGIVIAIVAWGARLLLVRQEGGYTNLGIFEAAMQWQAIILFLPGVFVRVVFPILAESFKNESKDEFKRAISIQVQATVMTALPLTVIAIAMSGPIAAIFGESFKGTDAVIAVLMLSVFFASLTNAMHIVYDGTGKRWTNFGMYLAWAIVYATIGFQLVPSYGATGLAFTQLLGDIFMLLITALYIDLFVARRALRQHIKLLLLSIAIIFAAYMGKVYLTGHTEFLFYAGLLIISILPAWIKIAPAKK